MEWFGGYQRVVSFDRCYCQRRGSSIVSCLHIASFDKLSFEVAGFVSISCGGYTNHTEENNIKWVGDADYIDVGQPAEIADASALGSYLHTLRIFPKPLNKSCYHLSVDPNVPHLLRLWFAPGNYSGFQNLSSFGFSLSIETSDMLAVQNITINMANISPFYDEKVLVSSGRELYICLIRTSETSDPFISAIELRRLRDGMYRHAEPGKMLSLISRYDVGGKSPVRYPQDEFDRLWSPNRSLLCSGHPDPVVNFQELISSNDTEDFPPSVVMQTACVNFTNGATINIGLEGQLESKSWYSWLLYFADIEPLNMILSTNGQQVDKITTVGNYSALEKAYLLDDTNSTDVELSMPPDSTPRLILNAIEIYSIFVTHQATYPKDIEALRALKMKFDITDWISDPCYLIEWKGIGCDHRSSGIRISEINLSGRNLTGSVPDNIRELTALVNLSLDNNNLTGTLPNISNLTMLRRLHLQNNNLTGRVPDWLCRLENLQELFIENNDFSGVIPAQLFDKPSLKFRHDGNRYLHMPPNPSKSKLRLIIGIISSGSLVIGLVLMAIIVVRHKKFKRKESSRVEKESKHDVDKDNTDKTVIIMPNTTTSRAFTLEELTEATENFSQKIGQGGFGSVFFGKLQQEKDIAVKVLSLFGKQGAQEFLNEVDLLSKVHHKNLVSLLGYCNESRELMLVYEHMSRGSLRDHLYGPSAELSQLNWKTRLKIVLDAARGLEYLHVGCNPKIIHRDIKTSNILLDMNFNGKLADFGLSRMTTDGEASHITTTVKGTMGYLDPEYFSTQMLTEKSDVYSFGVVLLEIICGRKPIDSRLPGERLNLIRWVRPYVEMDENLDKTAEIIDKRLGRNYDIKSIIGVAKLAIRCVQARPSSRPSVTEVVAELKETIEQEKINASLISEIDIKYEDLGASPACLSVDSSGPKEMDLPDSSSKLPQNLKKDDKFT